MADTSDLLKRVRKIEIKTRGLSRNIFAGEYHSAFKGRGMAFSEVREYQPGDDVRTIDWKVTARFNHPYIKIFEEERELTLMLLVDMSASGDFGSQEMKKRELIAELSATLAFSAIQNNDKIGMILFTEKVEKFIPPKKGKKHVLRLIRELLDFEPQYKGTNISEAVSHFNNMIKRHSTAFIISDFFDRDYDKPLKVAARKHDLIALKIEDIREKELPKMGLIQVKDLETGKMQWIDTSSKKVRAHYKASRDKWNSETIDLFRKSGVDIARIETGKSYVRPLVGLFKRRAL